MAYENVRPLYKNLVGEILFGLRRNLREGGFTGTEVQGRAKEIDSFLEKCSRKEYADPLSEITDLAGVRIICQFTTDIEQIESLIRNMFVVHETVDKTADLGTDRMGYQGLHLIVSLGGGHEGPRYDDLKKLRAEIQVRTILQDAWAHISHSLAYKSEASVPDRELRELNNVASLLEVAQEIFDRSSATRKEYSKTVESKRGSSDFLQQPIDRETVSAYTRWKYPDLPVNERIQELLIRDMDHSRYRQLAHIDQAVEDAKDAVRAYQQEEPSLFSAGTDYLTKSLGFSDERFQVAHPFATRTRSAFKKFGHLVKRGRHDA